MEIEIRFPEIYSDSGSNLTETESFLQRLANRRHLAYFAVKNHLIDVEKLKDLQNA